MSRDVTTMLGCFDMFLAAEAIIAVLLLIFGLLG